MEHIYKTLIKILSLKREQLQSYRFQFQGQPQIHLEKILLASSLKRNSQQSEEIINKFISYMSEQRSCKLTQEYFKPFQDIKFMSCHQRKVYTFDPQLRAYCIYGRAISLIRRKSRDAQTQRSGIVTEVQRVLFSLNQQNLLTLSKNQSHLIDDILMNYDIYEENFDPIYLSNEVFSPFMPHTYALVMVLPSNYPKQDLLINFLKSSLLHVYVEQSNVLSKVMFRETFYKNSIIRGIYFIQQGEVESTGGRIVARGWASNGRCKSSGYGWKFKPLPFLKVLAKNQHIWKQFANDLALNQEYPIKVNYILGLDDQMNFEIVQKKGHKKFLLPKIGHGSFDYGKLTQIQKVKHYDDRINDICDYKQKLLKRKAGSSLYKPLGRMVNSIQQRNSKQIMLKNSSSSRSRYNNSLTSSSQNILIMSVLKKLQNLTEQSSSNQQESKERRDKIKISPAHLYQKSRIMKKKRYNQ